MTTSDTSQETGRTQSDPNTELLIYAVAPANVHLDMEGIGRHPTPVRAVVYGPIAALVSEIVAEEPRDRIEDVQAFARLVDELAGAMPIIPIRFGATAADDKAVKTQLLQPRADYFHAALNELSGQAEYLVKGKYITDTVLREILDENQHAAALREDIISSPPHTDTDARIDLGQTVNAAMEDKRRVDSETLVRALVAVTDRIVLRPPTEEDEMAEIAVLIPFGQEQELLRTVNTIVEGWPHRVIMRIVGPLAPWDFFATEPESS
ncbi:GvpL/GvpF family gas vesicle protein [Nocardia sp. NPDC004722]